MDQLAAAAGVTKPILYKHFGDRSGLTKAIGDEYATGILDEIRAALASGGDDQVLLVAAVDAYLSFVERDPDLYRFLVMTGGDNAAVGAATLVDFMPRIAQEVALVLGERMRDAGLDSGAAEPWAYGIVGMVHLAGHWWLGRGTMPRARLVEYLTSLLWNGLPGSALVADESRIQPLPLAAGAPAAGPTRRTS